MNREASESRINSRYAYMQPFTSLVMGDVVHIPEKSPIRGEITDISNGGIGIYVGERLLQGAVLLVRIPVTGTEASIPTLVAVKWIKPNYDGYHAGLQFVVD